MYHFNVKNFMIYLLRNNNFLKIGFAKDVQRRMKCYNTCAFGYQLLDVRDGDKQVEKLLHKMFRKYQVAKEWFEDNNYIILHFHDSVERLVEQSQNIAKQRKYIRVWTSRAYSIRITIPYRNVHRVQVFRYRI